MKYKTVEALEQAIDAYFRACEGHVLEVGGEAVLDKHGQPVMVDRRPPTVTGLALALGFSSRQTMLNYQGRKQFNDTILKAKTRCEQYAEERLFDRDGTNGAQFSLRCNFGWNDKTQEHPSDPVALEKLYRALEGLDDAD